MSYFVKAQKILHGKLPNNPWGILTDGDPWKWFADIVEAKAADAVQLTKAQGHVTDQMVRE